MFLVIWCKICTKHVQEFLFTVRQWPTSNKEVPLAGKIWRVYTMGAAKTVGMTQPQINHSPTHSARNVYHEMIQYCFKDIAYVGELPFRF